MRYFVKRFSFACCGKGACFGSKRRKSAPRQPRGGESEKPEEEEKARREQKARRRGQRQNRLGGAPKPRAYFRAARKRETRLSKRRSKSGAISLKRGEIGKAVGRKARGENREAEKLRRSDFDAVRERDRGFSLDLGGGGLAEFLDVEIFPARVAALAGF